jgi:hypothetical protein
VLEAPLVARVINESASTVLFVEGIRVSTAPAAEPATAMVIVPIDAPAALDTVIISSAEPIAPSITVTTLVTTALKGTGT